MNNKDDDDKNIIHFPDLEKRQRLRKKEEKTARKEAEKQRKAQERLEEEYRASYRARKAKEQSNMARQSAAGKQPFFNWEKVPLFTRITGATLLIVHIATSFLASPEDKVAMIYYFGFVPAFYTGTVPWSWTALIAPFTTLILHSGWIHLAFNIGMMVVMGVFCERQFGAKRTAIFFLICGMAGNLVYFLMSPASTGPVIGASGAISGLFAFTLSTMIERGLVGPEAQKRGPLPFILIWSALIVGMGLISKDIAWQSHIGGFLGGVALFHFWKKEMVRF